MIILVSVFAVIALGGLIPINAYGSPPPSFGDAPIDEPLVLLRGEELTISWTDPTNTPLALSWKCAFASADARRPVFPEKGIFSVSLPRDGFGQLPRKLLVVPMNSSMRWLNVDVPPDQTELDLVFEPMEKDEAWFWGVTPSNPCPIRNNMNTAEYLSVSVRLIGNWSVFSRFSGLFVWRIVRDSNNASEIAFYFTTYPSDAVDLISSVGFGPAEDVLRARCHAHHGGECLHTMQTRRRSWGRMHQLTFVENKKFDPYRACKI